MTTDAATKTSSSLGFMPSSDSATWYQPTSNAQGGVPQYNEEKQFILDFINKNGRAPFLEEVNAWKNGQNTTGWTFTPESTAGRQGWAGFTIADYVKNRNMAGTDSVYGPGQGNLVPENAISFTDENGRPIFRTPDLRGDITQNYLRRGQFFNPPEGVIGGPTSNFVTPNGTYIRHPADMPVYNAPGEFQPKTIRDLSGQGNYQLYLAQLQDYLMGRVQQDTQQIDTLYTRYNRDVDNVQQALSAGEITQQEADNQLAAIDDLYTQRFSGLYTQDKANQTLKDAQSAVSWQMPYDQLPLYQDVQGITDGYNTNLWYNDYVNTQRGIYEGANQNSLENYQTAYDAARQADQGRNWYPAQPTVQEPTGTEQTDFLTYVSRLDLADNFKQWLSNNYYDYYNLWLQSGRAQSFLDWVAEYLTGEATNAG